MAKESYRHHYIPEFYQKRWTGSDGKLVVFMEKPHVGLVARLKTPAQTGWERRLYTSAALNRVQPDALEQHFMGPLDSVAAEVAEIFVTGDTGGELCRRYRDGWSRFLMSLMHRSPKRVAKIKAQFAETMASMPITITEADREDYDRIRKPGWPDRVEEYLELMRDRNIEAGGMEMIKTLSDSQLIGTHLNGMNQVVIKLAGNHHELLTSDQPLIVSGGLGQPTTFLMLALGPRHVFVATNTEKQMDYIHRNVDNGRVVLENNASVCRNAERFVYGTSLTQIGFVKKHFMNNTNR